MITGSLWGHVLLNGLESLLLLCSVKPLAMFSRRAQQDSRRSYFRTPLELLVTRWRSSGFGDASAPRWLAQTRSRTAAAVSHIIIDEHFRVTSFAFTFSHLWLTWPTVSLHSRLRHAERRGSPESPTRDSGKTRKRTSWNYSTVYYISFMTVS